MPQLDCLGWSRHFPLVFQGVFSLLSNSAAAFIHLQAPADPGRTQGFDGPLGCAIQPNALRQDRTVLAREGRLCPVLELHSSGVSWFLD